jgi:hypothetical protein
MQAPALEEEIVETIRGAELLRVQVEKDLESCTAGFGLVQLQVWGDWTDTVPPKPVNSKLVSSFESGCRNFDLSQPLVAMAKEEHIQGLRSRADLLSMIDGTAPIPRIQLSDEGTRQLTESKHVMQALRGTSRVFARIKQFDAQTSKLVQIEASIAEAATEELERMAAMIKDLLDRSLVWVIRVLDEGEDLRLGLSGRLTDVSQINTSNYPKPRKLALWPTFAPLSTTLPPEVSFGRRSN